MTTAPPSLVPGGAPTWTGALTGLPGELGPLVRLALPVTAAQVGMMLMGVVDTIMIGHHAGRDVGAIALGNLYAFGLTIPAFGVLLALDPLVSQAHGARDERGVELAVQRGFVLAVLLSIPVSLVMLVAAPVLRFLGQPEELVGPAAAYARAVLPGMLPLLLFSAARQTLQAVDVVRPVLLAVLAANVMNVLANWVLIFGNLGAPPLGVEGAGHATSLSRVVLAAVILSAGWPVLRRHARGWSSAALDPRALARMFSLGAPIGVQYALEVWAFSGSTILLGWVGVIELAGHQIALNLASFSFMLPFGISAAASVRVGQAIGRSDQPAAFRAGVASLALGTGVMLASAAAFTLFPRALARLYTPDAEVIATAALLLPLAGLFQVFDGAQAVAFGVLRGTGDTRVPSAANLVGYWLVGLPVGYLLTFSLGAGPRGVWWGMTLGLAVVAALLFLRIHARFRRRIARLA